MTSAAPQLDYAPSPRWHQCRRTRRLALLLAVLCLALATWKWGALARQKAFQLYWQYQCMAYMTPPDQVVYEEGDPDALLSNMRSRGNYWRCDYGVQLRPTCWMSFEAAEGWSDSAIEVVLFLHELRTPGGTPRLVRIMCDGGDHAHYMRFWTQAMKPATVFHHSSLGDYGEYVTRMMPVGFWDDGARFYGGRVDPVDPSRFSIRYQMGKASGVLVGGLREDGRVWLRVRDGPLERYQIRDGLHLDEDPVLP